MDKTFQSFKKASSISSQAKNPNTINSKNISNSLNSNKTADNSGTQLSGADAISGCAQNEKEAGLTS